MMRRIGGAQRLFAVYSYARAKNGDFTGVRRVSNSTLDVSNRVMQVDSALRGILASLRTMREICAACLEGDATADEFAARNAELDALKDNISRLSASVACTEFKMFSMTEGDVGSELRKIDEVINKMSGKISQLPEVSVESEEDSVSAWMRELFGELS